MFQMHDDGTELTKLVNVGDGSWLANAATVEQQVQTCKHLEERLAGEDAS